MSHDFFLSHYFFSNFNALINMERWIGLLFANVLAAVFQGKKKEANNLSIKKMDK